jgi:hypothetical protein
MVTAATHIALGITALGASDSPILKDQDEAERKLSDESMIQQRERQWS